MEILGKDTVCYLLRLFVLKKISADAVKEIIFHGLVQIILLGGLDFVLWGGMNEKI